VVGDHRYIGISYAYLRHTCENAKKIFSVFRGINWIVPESYQPPGLRFFFGICVRTLVIINPSLRSLRQLIAARCLYVGGVGFFCAVARVLSGLDACSCGDNVKSVPFLGDPVEQRMLVIIENGGEGGGCTRIPHCKYYSDH
jgi:hypothetical protein